MLGQLMYHRGINISQKLLIKMRKYFLMGVKDDANVLLVMALPTSHSLKYQVLTLYFHSSSYFIHFSVFNAEI
ncbi:TPA: hypothetical protein GF860_07315 [Citrobacter koseri]|nr:hypothetical protein [Citrobacter koseri]